MDKQLLKRAVLVSLAAPIMYALWRAVLGCLGYDPIPAFVPLPPTIWDVWPVVPGSILLGYHLAMLLSQLPNDKLSARAMGIGAVFSVLNVPISVFVALVGYHLMTPWKYGIICLLNPWVTSIPYTMLVGAPLAVPLGVIFGLAFAKLEARDRAKSAQSNDRTIS